MKSTRSGRRSLLRAAASAALFASMAAGALAALSSGAQASAGTPTAITVRVEGPRSTLLPATAVTLSAATVTKNGVAADSCSGLSAAGALQVATHGNWSGSWSSSYHSYFLTSIDGQTYPATGATYWAFWVNDAPASVGICAYDPKPGDSLLFFPDCYGKKCPTLTSILGVRAAAAATVKRPYTVLVTAYSEAKGTPSRAAGASVSGGGATARTGPSGIATLTFTHAGLVTLTVTAPDAIRTEASVCVESAAVKACK
jgi:hypothetical protein